MMYEMINRMKEEINAEIKHIATYEKKNGRTDHYYAGYNRIIGMIKMLHIVTGKDYTISESGLKEKEA